MPKHKVTILDGGMGRELQRLGAPFKQPEWSALALMEAPHLVQQAHQSYLSSGASVIITNSYALVPFHIGEQVFSEQAYTLISRAGELAKAARDNINPEAIVAASIPPLFGSYRSDLYNPNRAVEIVSPLIKAQEPYADVWILETQSLIEEATTVVQQIRAQSQLSKPIWVAFTLEDLEPTNVPKLRSGETVEEAVTALGLQGIEAVLFNCCQPETIETALETAAKVIKQNGWEIETGAYANTFPAQTQNATANDGLSELRSDLTPPAYLRWAQKWREKGASLIGGCCGIGPDHIAVLSKQLK